MESRAFLTSRKLIFLLITTIFLFANPSTSYAYDFNNPPSRIIIPTLDINLPVSTAKINFTTWEVSLTGASFGESSSLPGNIGNTVIFAHVRIGLFLNLPKIKVGDIVHVFTSKDWFTYKVRQIEVVSPEDISVLNDSSEHELTLYTCIGENWTQRFVAKAQLINSISPDISLNLN